MINISADDEGCNINDCSNDSRKENENDENEEDEEIKGMKRCGAFDVCISETDSGSSDDDVSSLTIWRISKRKKIDKNYFSSSNSSSRKKKKDNEENDYDEEEEEAPQEDNEEIDYDKEEEEEEEEVPQEDNDSEGEEGPSNNITPEKFVNRKEYFPMGYQRSGNYFDLTRMKDDGEEV